jgi:hypothetical protein
MMTKKSGGGCDWETWIAMKHQTARFVKHCGVTEEYAKKKRVRGAGSGGRSFDSCGSATALLVLPENQLGPLLTKLVVQASSSSAGGKPNTHTLGQFEHLF